MFDYLVLASIPFWAWCYSIAWADLRKPAPARRPRTTSRQVPAPIRLRDILPGLILAAAVITVAISGALA